jgi:uncharacterized phage protein (TIGR01671 family)
MRTIKFRVWDKDRKLIGFNRFEKGRWQCQMLQAAGGSDEWSSGVLHGQAIDQYTGLGDKNGKEIYEGDLLAGTLLRAEVEWRDGAFWIRDRIGMYLNQNNRFQLLHLKARNLKVIGNVHENPELLEPEAKQ